MEQHDQEMYSSVITRRAVAVLLPILLALGLVITGIAIVRAQSSGRAVSLAVPMGGVTAAGNVYTLYLPVVIRPVLDLYGYVYYNSQPASGLKSACVGTDSQADHMPPGWSLDGLRV